MLESAERLPEISAGHQQNGALSEWSIEVREGVPIGVNGPVRAGSNPVSPAQVLVPRETPFEEYAMDCPIASNHVTVTDMQGFKDPDSALMRQAIELINLQIADAKLPAGATIELKLAWTAKAS